MCLPFESIEPNTEAARKCVKTLKMLAIAQAVIAILKWTVFQDIMGGFYELLSILILWMAWSQLSYCICLMYIVYICILGTITYLVNLLTPVQNGQPFFGDTGLKHAVVACTLIFLVYYVVAAYYAFQAYKEFKAYAYEQNGMNSGFFNMGGNNQGGQSIGGNGDNRSQQQTGMQGRGQAIGGASYGQPSTNRNAYGANQNYGGAGNADTEAYSSSQNLNNQSTQQNTSSNQNRGGAQQSSSSSSTQGNYFTGKGVRIG